MKNNGEKSTSYIYTPTSSPTATDLSEIGKLTDYFEADEQIRWAKASRQPDVFESMTNDIGSFHAVEIDGNLHVKGDFNVAEHRISALWIKGDLLVDGVYMDQSHPTGFVLIEGNLHAKNIVTGGQLEVHGNVVAEHLAGDYNDYGAKFFGSTTATTFLPETHSFELLGGSDIALTLGVGVPDPESMDFYITAFIGDAFVDSFGDVNNSAIIAALAQGQDITLADPRDPSSITCLNVADRRMKSLPDSLYAFVNLTELDISDNEISTLDGLEHLSKLNTLSVVGNPLETFSEALISLPLKTLNVGYWNGGPDEAELPEWFSRWESLETLELIVEELETLPKVIANIGSLSRLVLAHWMKWETLLADVVSQLPEMNLEQLCMSSGTITHLPEDLRPFATLKVLELTDQKFDDSERSRIIEALPSVDVYF